jgi:hypothetical protein
MPQALARQRTVKTVTMAEATLNDGQTLHAVNDLFVGQRSHVSARYKIAVAGHQEQQSSSGIIVSTGLGSTGWLKSVYAGWAAATHTLLKRDLDPLDQGAFPWDADYLHYLVREPYPSRTTQAGIVIGRIAHADRMTIVSQMPENGVIFSDGIESDYLEFNSGTLATIGVAEKRGLLAV